MGILTKRKNLSPVSSFSLAEMVDIVISAIGIPWRVQTRSSYDYVAATKQVMVDPTDEETKHIKDQKFDTRGYPEHETKKDKIKVCQLNVGWGTGTTRTAK